MNDQTLSAIEALPDGGTLEFYTFDGGWPVHKRTGLTTDALKSLISSLASELREYRQALTHYADESFWDDSHPDLGHPDGTIYNFEDEIDGAIPGYQIAREALAKSLKEQAK